ncbi:MAG: DUF4230 domain-containing protein [Planctomycetota bacterium]
MQSLSLWSIPLCIVLLLALGGIFGGRGCPGPVSIPPAPVTVTSQGPTIERLQRLAQLVTLRVYVADVLTAEGAGYRGAWLIKGDGLVGVDLGRAEISEKDESARRAVILLPQPTVILSRVDHERTKTWEVARTTWVPWSGDQDRLRDEVMKQAQALVAHAAGSDENLEKARQAAEAVLTGLYGELQWQIRGAMAGVVRAVDLAPARSKDQ